MSGSSYNYLCWSSVGVDRAGSTGMLPEMVERLEAHYPGSRAAINARALLSGLEALEKLMRTLETVFHAEEWSRSGDCTEADVEEAVRAYEVSP